MHKIFVLQEMKGHISNCVSRARPAEST